MAANGITDVEANATLDARIVAGDVVDLVTVMGTATVAPTKVTGGSYAAQTPTWAAASAREKHNSATVTYAGLPTVGGGGILGIDMAATGGGARKWFVPFAAGRTTVAGDSMIFTSGGMSFSFVNSP